MLARGDPSSSGKADGIPCGSKTLQGLAAKAGSPLTIGASFEDKMTLNSNRCIACITDIQVCSTSMESPEKSLSPLDEALNIHKARATYAIGAVHPCLSTQQELRGLRLRGRIEFHQETSSTPNLSFNLSC